MRKTAIVLLIIAAFLGIVWIERSGRRSAPEDEPARAEEDGEPSQATSPAPAPTSPDTQIRVELPDVLIDPKIHISKAARRLELLSDGVVVKTYPIVLGPNDAGDKEVEGDGRTPEGEFYVCNRNPDSRYHRALGLSYPSYDDAERGLDTGVITKREYTAINSALDRMARPPWNTALGGEIMIHGGGTTRDWTLGCVALDDTDAEELYNAVPLGTPVVIGP
jgi:murein L,D-transpeptidase YafK